MKVIRIVMAESSVELVKDFCFEIIVRPSQFPSPNLLIFFFQNNKNKNSRFTSQRIKYFNVQAYNLVLLTTIIIMLLCDVLVFDY